MFFTQEDFRKIEEWLSKRTAKDTDFVRTNVLTTDDLVPIIQDNINKTTMLTELARYVGALNKDYINVTAQSKQCNLSLREAICLIPEESKRIGQTITFIDENGKWVIYQFNSDDICNWDNPEYWNTIYSSVSKFKGHFESEDQLLDYIPYPSVGDYAYVGDNIEEAILYICKEEGIWKSTCVHVLTFIDSYKTIFSKDFDVLDYNIDEQYSDRAEKDSLGRIIHFTYVTKEGLSEFVINKVLNAIAVIELPDNCIKLQHLTQSVKDYIASGGNIVNMPDEEDLTETVEDNERLLKFKDKEYNPTYFSGKGRKYLRKNLVDGINVLEQYMIDSPNTIYIIQYDYCLNDNTITIPENCELKFEGGTINGGTLVLNNTKILNVFHAEEIGINLTIEGNLTKGQSLPGIN